MSRLSRLTWWQLLTFAVVVLVVKVNLGVVWGYRNYFPPNFETDFLRGRDAYFFSRYAGAFYVHLVSGPPTLFLGLVLLSARFRARFPRWHRRLGRVQVALILLLLVPSGLWMAYDAVGGVAATIGFALLSLLTGATAALGWRAAVRRKFAVHRRWMERCFVLLASAVVIRLIGGTATYLELYADWLDPLTAWASWLVPLAIYELATRMATSPRKPPLPARAGT